MDARIKKFKEAGATDNQVVYLMFKEDVENDTMAVLEYLKWLKKEKGVKALKDLLNLELTGIEQQFIRQQIDN